MAMPLYMNNIDVTVNANSLYGLASLLMTIHLDNVSTSTIRKFYD